MISVSDQQGMSLVELLVAMLISLLVMGILVGILTVVLNDNRYANFRSDAQADAQALIDRMSRDLRSAASTSAGASGLLEKAAPYDIVFETVNANGGSAPSGDPADQIRVRYCLDSNNTLWRQTQTLQTPTDTIPDTGNCPNTTRAGGAGWDTTFAELSDVTNEIGGDTTRPLFQYGPTGAAPSSPYTSTSLIKSVEIHLIVDRNPGHLPGPTDLTSGVYLRNELGPPTAQFSVTKTPETNGTDINLNGSTSTDPNGQTLSYQWYQNVTCPSSGAPSSGAISGATSQQWDLGTYSTSQTIALVVTNTGGLTSCQSTTVSVP
jgi:Tfp pilus assembly protein PilV